MTPIVDKKNTWGNLQPHTDIQINTSEGAVNYIYILDKLMQLSFKAIYM